MAFQSIILAGGKGTRLSERLNGLPKPLVSVGGVPLLQRQIESLKSFGVDKIVILVNHKKEHIEKFIQEHDSFGVDIKIVDDGEPKGTGGALISASNYLEDEFLVVYGDTLFNIDLNRFIQFHQNSRCDASLLVHPNDHPSDSDLIDVDENHTILGFFPYPHSEPSKLQNIVNAAMYVINKNALLNYATGIDIPSDLAKHVFPKMIENGATLKAYSSPEYIKDLGTPARLDKVEAHLSDGVVQRQSLLNKQKAVFIDRDGTLNFLNGHIRRAEDIVFFEGIGTSMKQLQESSYRTVLVTNQPVVARGEATTEDIKAINAKLDFELSKSKSYFDAKYMCFHHPDSGYDGEVKSLKISCDCRKPNPGLIFRAKSELNIDLALSWFIGDTSADFGAAKNAGVNSIGVKTGEGSADHKYDFLPDIVCDDFNSAVDFICKQYLEIKNTLSTIDNVHDKNIVMCGANPNLAKAAEIALNQELGLNFAEIDNSKYSAGVMDYLRRQGAKNVATDPPIVFVNQSADAPATGLVFIHLKLTPSNQSNSPPSLEIEVRLEDDGQALEEIGR